MNKLQLTGNIKDIADMANEHFGRLAGSLDKQARGVKLRSEGWAKISRGDDQELADAVLYDEDTARRRAFWVHGKG